MSAGGGAGEGRGQAGRGYVAEPLGVGVSSSLQFPLYDAWRPVSEHRPREGGGVSCFYHSWHKVREIKHTYTHTFGHTDMDMNAGADMDAHTVFYSFYFRNRNILDRESCPPSVALRSGVLVLPPCHRHHCRCLSVGNPRRTTALPLLAGLTSGPCRLGT